MGGCGGFVCVIWLQTYNTQRHKPNNPKNPPTKETNKIRVLFHYVFVITSCVVVGLFRLCHFTSFFESFIRLVWFVSMFVGLFRLWRWGLCRCLQTTPPTTQRHMKPPKQPPTKQYKKPTPQRKRKFYYCLGGSYVCKPP